MQFIKNQKAMTLIELVVVMAILALLASIAATQVMGRLGKARIEATKTQIKNFEQALELYKADNDRFPTTEQGLQALIEQPTAGVIPENYPPEGYIKKKQLPKDPWGSPYVYMCEDGEKYSIMSYGADKKEGGEAKNADISSDDL